MPALFFYKRLPARFVVAILKDIRGKAAYDRFPMIKRRRPPGGETVLEPVSVRSLQGAVERLREPGMTTGEAAAQVVRENIYEWIDDERDGERIALRLRIVKP